MNDNPIDLGSNPSLKHSEEEKEDSGDGHGGKFLSDPELEDEDPKEPVEEAVSVSKSELPIFHIAIDGPADNTFPSFHSSELEGGDPTHITMSMIRQRCSISSKLYFTADGKNRIAESTTLKYYMEITGRDHGLLDPPGSKPKPSEQPEAPELHDDEQHKDEGDKEDEKSEKKQKPKPKPKTEPKVKTVIIQVTSPSQKAAGSLLALPAIGKDIAALLDKTDSGGLERGTLPGIAEADRKLLADSYGGAKAVQTQYNISEPSELTETQWHHILTNNRALYGFHVDLDTKRVYKARRPAFQMVSETKKPVKQVTSAASKKGKREQAEAEPPITVPMIPPFYVHDDATVQITEISTTTKKTLVEEGFTASAIEMNSSLKAFGALMSAGYSDKTEKSEITQEETRDKTSALHVAYKFPRVVVELDSSCIELTPECREDADEIIDIKGAEKFFKKYGTEFTTRFTLGGRLHSYRTLTEHETQNLDQTKDKTRTAAGVSFQIPALSFSLTKANVTSHTTETGKASLDQDLRLTWEATGGNTLLCSNPPEWASTVKDHRLWRLMDKDEVVHLKDIIRLVDTSAYTKITDPKSQGFRGKNPFKDADYMEVVEDTLHDALNSARVKGNENAMIKVIKQHYRSAAFDRVAYNKFVEKVWQVKEGIIDELSKWEVLDDDQKMGIGIWCLKLGIITI